MSSIPASRQVRAWVSAVAGGEEGQRADEAAALGERDEPVGHHHAVAGMAPAHERLRADDPPRAQVGLRLVVHDELVAVRGLAQLARQLELGRIGLVLAGDVHLVARPLGLGAVHRDVGALHELLEVGGVHRVERNPDRRLDVERQPLDRERLLERAVHRTGDLLGRAGARDVCEQDAELVATEAGDGVGLAQDAVQARADLAQEEIAGVVAERVVDLLEPVEVDQEQRGIVPVARARQDRLVGAVAKEASVRKRRERVVARVVGGTLGVLLELLGPPSQLARRARDQPEEDGVEHREPDHEHEVEPVRVVCDRGRDGRVGDVELKCASRRARALRPDRRVHLEQVAVALDKRAVLLLDVPAVRDHLRRRGSPERLAELGGRLALGAVADERRVGRVDDRPLLVPDLDAGHVQVAGRQAAHGVVERLGLGGRQTVCERVAGQMRLDPEPDRQVGGLHARVERAVVDLASEVVREHESEHDNRHRACNGELPQEADPGAQMDERKGQSAKRDWVTE